MLTHFAPGLLKGSEALEVHPVELDRITRAPDVVVDRVHLARHQKFRFGPLSRTIWKNPRYTTLA